jgi:hypothetical protein
MSILRLSFAGISETDLARFAREFLDLCKIEPAEPFDPWTLGEWETQEEFCERTGIADRTFRRRMEDRRFMPMGIELEEGPSGRLVRLRSHLIFEKWVRG